MSRRACIKLLGSQMARCELDMLKERMGPSEDLVEVVEYLLIKFGFQKVKPIGFYASEFAVIRSLS
jgi:hypothetical protein